MGKKELQDIRRVLVSIDMVNGFIYEGNLHDESIRKIIGEHVRLIKKFLTDREEVIFFRDAHDENCEEFKYFPPHCIKGTEESEIITEFYPYTRGRRIYDKNSTAGIFAKGYLDDVDKMLNLEEMVFIGCCTDLCVMNFIVPQRAYFNEHNRNVKITVPTNAIATYHADTHDAEEYGEMAIKLMKLNGINVVSRYE